MSERRGLNDRAVRLLTHHGFKRAVDAAGFPEHLLGGQLSRGSSPLIWLRYGVGIREADETAASTDL